MLSSFFRSSLLRSPRALIALGAFAFAAAFVPLSVYAKPTLEPGCSHTVRRGDTLSAIAASHGTTVRELAQANNILKVNYLWIGARLTIPGCGRASAKPAAPVAPGSSHVGHAPDKAPAGCIICTISAGQSLAWLADDYGSTVADIVRLNKLTSNTVYPGQRLVVCPKR